MLIGQANRLQKEDDQSKSLPENDITGVANKILDILFENRRLLLDQGTQGEVDDHSERGPHIDRIANCVAQSKPIHLILPAFPAKSPNRRKTLGDLPDMGERLGLQRLQTLCDRIAAIYEFGAKCKICSDGRVFSDLVLVDDTNVSAYRESLKAIMAEENCRNIEFFDLDDVMPAVDYTTMREDLLVNHAESLKSLMDRVRSNGADKAMFNGIHRFIFEDMIDLNPRESRNAARERAKMVAYRVIQRSNAWTRLIAREFPEAVRLSIHPQPKVSSKIGIYLVDTDNPWGTPWHGVVLRTPQGDRLIRRQDAESTNAFLVFRDGRPSHFVDPACFGVANAPPAAA